MAFYLLRSPIRDFLHHWVDLCQPYCLGRTDVGKKYLPSLIAQILAGLQAAETKTVYLRDLTT